MPSVRRARRGEAEALTSIAHEAKASWGYSPDLLRLWRDELTVTPEWIDSHPAYVAVEDDRILGFCGLCPAEGGYELEHMWVRPGSQGAGIGSALWREVVDHLLHSGGGRLRIVSDPNAEGFYLRMGAVRSGQVESTPAGRRLPVLVFEWDADDLEP